MTVRLFVNDLGSRSRFETVLPRVPEDMELAVVDLSDPSAVEAFRASGAGLRGIGFYPHVRKDLADLARELGIEPVEKRVLFGGDVAEVLRGFA